MRLRLFLLAFFSTNNILTFCLFEFPVPSLQSDYNLQHPAFVDVYLFSDACFLNGTNFLLLS